MTDEHTMLYLLTIEGVADHGCAGIFTDKVEAIKHATILEGSSDGYHAIRINEIPMNVGLIDRATLRTGSTNYKSTMGTGGFISWGELSQEIQAL